MTKPSQSGMPGFGQMADPLDFVKRLWGGMSVPGMVVPTVSIDELNQKITDLKTVETWLNLNLSMLRSTIQALEVQSATLSTLQSMGAAMGAAMKPGEDGKPAFANFFPPPSGDKKVSADGDANPFAYPNWPAPAPKPGASSTSTSPMPGAPDPAAQQAAAPPASDTAKDDAAGSGPATTALPDFSAAMAAPSAWWNMLQNQFVQAVSQAMADSKETPNGAANADAPAKSAAKPAPKSSGKAATGEAVRTAGISTGSRSSSSSAKSTGATKSPARKPKG